MCEWSKKNRNIHRKRENRIEWKQNKTKKIKNKINDDDDGCMKKNILKRKEMGKKRCPGKKKKQKRQQRHTHTRRKN